MHRTLATGSMSHGDGGDMELQAVLEESTQEVPNNSSRSQREATHIDGINDLSSESFTDTDQKLRGPLLAVESTRSLSAHNTTSHSQGHALEIDAGPGLGDKNIGSDKIPEASPSGLLLTEVGSFMADWTYTALIGVFVVSYWRVRLPHVL